MPNAILDPTGSVKSKAATAAAPRARRPASLNGARVGLLINTKQNARPFLEEVGRLLTEKYDVTLTERTKVNFAVPEPDEVIKELVADSDVVITGVGDCGSCSAAGAAGYKYATTAHPVAVLTEDKVKERAAQVLDDVVALLTDSSGKND